MRIRRNSVQFEILDCLCSMPKAVRGMAPAMLQRRFGDLGAVEDLAAAGLVKKRGWSDGPGWIWVPTEAGEALHREISAAPRLESTVDLEDLDRLPQRSS
jgi:hypothetical protein